MSVADQLKQTPRSWGRVGEYANQATAKVMASRIRTGTASSRWEPAGAFEARWAFEGGEFVVYARFVGRSRKRVVTRIREAS